MLQAIERDLHLAIGLLETEQYPAMVEMIAYHLGWLEAGGNAGGKRIRPLLTMLTCAAFGGEWRRALPVASGVELIHNFSLVHDDIQDGSRERRGRPTLWARWGVPQALNTGDAMWALARLSLLRLQAEGFPGDIVLEIQRILDEACLHLTEGQHLDLAFESQAVVPLGDYMRMIEGKTAALVSAAAQCGACIAGAAADIRSACARFGRHLGLAFQILDDILGIWGSADRTGKPAGDDLRSHKKSLPVLHGLAHSEQFRALWSQDATDEQALLALTSALEAAGSLEFARSAAEDHTTLALAALEEAGPSGEAGDELSHLARRLLQRDR